VTNTQTGARLTTRADAEGRWVISGMQPGAVKVDISSPGFKVAQYDLQLQASLASRIGTTLEVAAATETVTITDSSSVTENRIQRPVTQRQVAQLNMPSQNVFNLQRKVAGVLPVRIEVPRSGKSYRFVRPLVLDEETRITFQYKSK
ncbi:MAG TPA: carboxypeptidase-like regulatory domain-containing protein, partial [Pyrinomonadaceae bacterium]|nr:carboxypeptidase-like regulatory domain-containing protein [Pyrinomonadaceae bacterium]